MIQFNPQIHSVVPKPNVSGPGAPAQKPPQSGSPFADTIKAVGNQLGKVDELQKASDASIKDLLSGKNEDITSVVSTVAKADMSFKLLVGVRNKLVEAYKETMNMPL
jgi:flagellar hook-basal body complex protein FliE